MQSLPVARATGCVSVGRGRASVVTKDAEQLAALASVIEALTDRGIDYWLFGGWAVDFYAGKVTRPHDDVDLAVWLADHDHVAELLASGGWKHAPHPEEDGGTGYERGAVRLELTFLLRGDDGAVLIPLRAGRVPFSKEPFGDDVAELGGVRARVIPLDVLRSGKSHPRDDASDAAKDRADSETLSRVR